MDIARSSLVALVVIAAACARPQDARIEVVVSDALLTPEMKVELMADGTPARFLRWQESSGVKDRVYEVHVAVTGKTKKVPELKLKALFGCGWRERKVTLSQDWPAEELLAQNARGEAARHDALVEAFAGDLASLWVDNRKGAAGTLSLGPVKLAVAADRVVRLEAATCDAPIPVSFEGKPMGAIPPAGKYTGAPSTVFIDPTGKRCYGRYTLWYGERRYDGGAGGRSKTERLSGRSLYYSADFIAYVFEKPPTARLSMNGESPSATVLEDAKCR